MRGPQGWEWLVILIIVLLLFGARKLPDLARSVGSSLKIFRREVTDTDPPAGPVSPAGPAPRDPAPPEATRRDDDAVS